MGTYKPPVKAVRTCKSVGDPHVYPFEKTHFDTHIPGWVTLYKKGKLIIDAEQKVWASNNQGVAINRAVRYSTDGGVKFTTLQNGQKGDVDFPDHSVKLTVRVQDYSSRRNINADCKFIYDLFVTTNNYAGASGQCVEGKLASDKSDQLPFPSGNGVRVTETQAKAACAAISDADLRADCVTDVRMVNDPDVTGKLVDGFKTVEATDKALRTTKPATPCSARQYKRGRWFTSNSFQCPFNKRLLTELFNDKWPATADCRRRPDRWNHQVIIFQNNQGGNAACTFYSLKDATDTPCTWTKPVELANGDAHTGPKWYLPATPGNSECASCPNGMVCDGLNLRMPTTTPPKPVVTPKPSTTAAGKSIMCGNRYGLPSTNKKANWGTDGYLATCKRECAQDPSCVAITYEEDQRVWCFGCKDLSTRTSLHGA